MWFDDVSRIYSEAASITRDNERGDYHVLLDDLDNWIDTFNYLKTKIESLNSINWDKIPIDTLVEVKESGDKQWTKRYFAGVENTGRPQVFVGGCTSKTALDTFIPAQIRLAKEE